MVRADAIVVAKADLPTDAQRVGTTVLPAGPDVLWVRIAASSNEDASKSKCL